jgi:putative endonuclease
VSIAPTDLKHNTSYQDGLYGEQLVKEHYQQLGFTCLKTRYKTRYGELDLVFLKDDLLLFVEVKTRRSLRPQYELITKKQMIRNSHAAQVFLGENENLLTCNMQFNLVLVVNNKIVQIYESAWDDMGE